MNSDIWRELRGELPCLESSPGCIQQLQSKATQDSALLTDIDSKIEELQSKIDEAVASNKKSINLAILTPGLQILINPINQTGSSSTKTTTTTSGNSTTGLLGNLGLLLSKPSLVIDKVLGGIAIPLIQSFFGGAKEQRDSAIATTDLQLKVTQLSQVRAQMANAIKEKVLESALDLDQNKREFQATLLSIQLLEQQTKIVQLEFRLGQHSSLEMLAQEKSFNEANLSAFRQWGTLKSSIQKLKVLVLGVEDL
jgi:hypothetical protein